MKVLAEDANIRRKKLTAKATVIFLAMMFVLTFFSRTINNFTLPKVTYETPAKGALIKAVTGTGSVEANITRELYASSSMKVTGVTVEAGDRVKQGQTLMTLDTSDIKSQLEDEQDKYAQKKLQLEALLEAGSPSSLISLDKAVQVARQNADKARKSYDSSKALFEAGAITSISLADAEADLENAKLDYEIAKNNKDKAVKANKRDIESTMLDISMAERSIVELSKEMNMGIVTAPCDGVVTELYYSEGMTVTASQPLYRIADTGKGFQFVATVNISAAEYLEPGDEAKISINSLKDTTIQGKVSSITDNQQQIGVKKDVLIDIPSEGLVGREAGTADIKKGIGAYSILVSNSAVGQDNYGFFVYVLKEREGPLGNEFYAERVSVSVGDSDNTKTAVLSGINNSDNVISDSDKQLSDGSPVMVAD